jgi:hypothetical protein
MIKKKTIRAIKWGDHDELINAFIYLLDTYNEDKFDNGYKSCLEDMSIYAKRLTEAIAKEAERRGVKPKKKSYFLEQYEIEQIINDFFTDIINDYGKKTDNISD